MPAVVNQEGVREIIELRLDPKEKIQFAKSVAQLREVLATVKD